MGGLDFLRSVNSGKTKKLSGDVVVIGGGNAAIDVARAARRLTKGSVNMYCLEKDEECPQFPMRRTQASPTALLSTIPGRPRPSSARAARSPTSSLCAASPCATQAASSLPFMTRTRPSPFPARTFSLPSASARNTARFLAGTAAETPDGSLIDHNGVTFQTEEADIFVGGDCATGPKYTIDAIASGREGAVSIHRYVNVGQTLTIHRNLREFKELDKQNITLPAEKFKKPARAEAAIDQNKVLTMQDDRVTFTEEQIKSEASRCLSCGRSVVDPNKCIGCGICTTKCEFDAIHLKRNRPQNSKMIPAEDKFKAIGPYAAKRQVKIIKKKLSGK